MLQGGVKRLARQVRDRAEDRDVQVDYHQDVNRLCVDAIHQDTGEIVSSRPMTADEIRDAQQIKLPFGKPRKGGDAA
jgi:hypothetical protein